MFAPSGFGFHVDFKNAKRNFFDRGRVIDRLSKVKRKKFNLLGVPLTRKIARRSIKQVNRRRLAKIITLQKELIRLRKRKNQTGYVQARIAVTESQVRALQSQVHSKPGKPPKSIQGNLKKFLLYSYDSQSESVVIGPALLGSGTGAPETLEYGGFVTTKAGGRRAEIKPRPYMGPAREKAEPYAAEYFRDSL